MEFDLLRILLLICSLIIACVMFFFTIRSSDQKRSYRFITLLFFIPFTIFEILHLYVPDPLRIFDYLTHLFGGLLIFLVFSNISRIKKELRSKISLFITFIFIVLLELLLSLTNYQSISFDILIDIFLVLGGGIIGYILFLFYNRNVKRNY